MRIAIVGSGIAGLTCAHELHRRHEITLFEAAGRLGGHTNTVRVDLADETHHVDTGFIVHNDRNYPGFRRLLGELGVATQPSEMSFSVSDGAGFEYNGSSPNGLFACRAHLVAPSFHRMLRDLVRFNREARGLIGLNGSGPSLGAFLEAGGYSRAFVERLIVPQASAVWSADPAQMWEFPASFLAEFFDNHGHASSCAAGRAGTPSPGGAKAYVDAPDRAARRPHPAVDAGAVDPARAPTGSRSTASASTRWCSPRTPTRRWRCSPIPAAAEVEVLGAIPYQRNEAVLHTDAPPAAAAPARVGELELPPRRASRPGGRRSPTT